MIHVNSCNAGELHDVQGFKNDAHARRLYHRHNRAHIRVSYLRSTGWRPTFVVRILNQLAAEYGAAIIVVTHDEKIIPTFKRIYYIRDGRTVEEAGEGRPLH